MLRIQRTVLSAKEVPPNAKTLTFFDTTEPKIWLPVGVNKSELGSDCAEGGKGVMRLSDCNNQHGAQHCYNQHSSLDRTPSGAQLCTPTCVIFPSLGQSSEWAFLGPTVNLYTGIMAKERTLSGRCWHVPIGIFS